MKLNVELLETLKCELCNWKSFDEAQLQHKMRAFEKFPRAEYSTFYKPILTNECLMNSLVELGEAFFANSNLLCDVVSSMGYIIRRYGYVPSTTVFCLFTRAATNKKARYYVSLHLSSFPQFSTWAYRWDYLLSMPKIAPRKLSITNFHGEVKRLLHTKTQIPAEVVQHIADLLNAYVAKAALSDYSKTDYLNTICLLKRYLPH